MADAAGMKVGTKATITLESLEKGFQVGLDFHGENMSQDPTVIQTLAMVGCDAIREAIRETFNVEQEHCVRSSNQKH
jgi:hypothetical protein